MSEHTSIPTLSVASASAVTLQPAGPSLWRVVDRRGIVIGHLQSLRLGTTTRFRARRFRPSAGRFRELGEFWRVDDAIDCLRFAR